jgi:hypothetical protein
MTLREFCLEHNVRIESKRKLPLMRAAAWVMGVFSSDVSERFLRVYFTTYRKPFGKGIIAIPDCVNMSRPSWIDDWRDILDHELIHVEQQRGPWGLFKSFCLYFLFPLPVLFSGRWYIERDPYLKVDIARGRKSPRSAAEQLWRDYFYPWPKNRMHQWFDAELKKILDPGIGD